MFDLRISDGEGDMQFLGVLVIAVIWSWYVYGAVPKRKHLKDPSDMLVLLPWNMFDREKWTDEGVRFHKRVVLSSILTSALLSGAFLYLDWRY